MGVGLLRLVIVGAMCGAQLGHALARPPRLQLAVQPPAPGVETVDVLSARLATAERRRRHATTLWPWTVLAVGTAIALGATIKGATETFDCGRDCPTRPLTGALVIGGLGVATGGYLWLRLRWQHQAELQSRIYQLRWRLMTMDPARPMPTSPLTEVPLLQGTF